MNLIKQKNFLLEVPHFKTLYYCYASDKNIYDDDETVEVKVLMVDFLQGLQLIDADYKVSEKFEEALESLKNHEINEAVLLLRKLSPNVFFVDKANALLAIIIHELFEFKSRNNCLEPGLDSECVNFNIKKLLARGQSYNRGKNYCRALHDIWYEEKCEDWVNDDSQPESEKVDVLENYIHGLYHKIERDKLPEIDKETFPKDVKLPKNVKKTIKKRKEENALFIDWSKKNIQELPLSNIEELMDLSEKEYDLNMLAELKYGHLPNYIKTDLSWILSIIN